MDRTVLSPSAEFDPSKPTPSNPSPFPPPQIRLVALSSSLPNSQPLLYAGTTSGTLLLLPASTAADPKPPDTSPIAFLDAIGSVSVGNSPVDDVLVLPEIDRVLVLSDGVVSVFDRGLLRSGQRLGAVKRVAAVAKRLRFGDSASADPLGDVDKWSDATKTRQRFLQRLGRANGSRARGAESQRDGEGGGCCFVAAAVVGKGLVLMELFLDNSVDGAVSVVTKEVQGVEGAKTMVWFDDSIIVGMSQGYVLFSTRSGQITPIFSLPESSGPPRLKPLCRSKEVLLLMDNVGIVINVHGQPVGGSLIFRCVPDSVVEMSQYVVSSEDGCLKLYRKKAGNCVQTISVSKSRSGPCVMASVEWGNGEIIAVATPHKITCFHKIYAEDQIKDLLRKKYFKEAVCLMEELESEGEMSKEMLSFVHAQVGFLLLYDLHFEDAVKHFLLSDTMQPSEIFPFIMRDPNRWSSLVPRNRYWGLHPPPMLLEQVIDEGLTAIQRALFLKKAGVDTAIDEDYVSNPPNRADLLESAIKNMTRYMLICRNKDLASMVREGVDTLLMYLYRALDLVDDMEKLASSPNSCVVEPLCSYVLQSRKAILRRLLEG